MMKVSVEKLPSSEAVLEVEVPWEELEKASDKAYRKLVQKVDVPGFRRGKAPRSLLERRLGKEYIYQEAIDDLISDAYRNAVQEHELTPLTQPELEAPVFEMGQPYHFSLKVPILSPVELGDYRSLHFEREEADITSEEVEQEIESMRNRQATWDVVERPAEIGDRVTVDLKLTVDDETVSDLKDNPFELTDERHGLFTGMDEQIVGMSANESKEFTTTIPADYGNEKLAGKEAHYAVTLHKVETREVPELDDTFAIQVSNDQYQTMEDLRKAVSDALLENKERRIRDELREQVVNAVIEQSNIPVHPVLISEEAEEIMHQFSHILEQQHISMDQYLVMMRKSREEYLKELEPEAEQRVKRQLVLDAVAQAEDIITTPEEIEGLFRAYAQTGQNLPRSEAQIRALASAYRREKALTRLVELTTPPDLDEEEAEASIANAEAAAVAGEEAVDEGEAAEFIAPETQAAEEAQTANVTEGPEQATTLQNSEVPAETVGEAASAEANNAETTA